MNPISRRRFIGNTGATGTKIGCHREAGVGLGGVAPTSWRLPEVAGLLRGQRITAELAA